MLPVDSTCQPVPGTGLYCLLHQGKTIRLDTQHQLGSLNQQGSTFLLLQCMVFCPLHPPRNRSQEDIFQAWLSHQDSNCLVLILQHTEPCQLTDLYKKNLGGKKSLHYWSCLHSRMNLVEQYMAVCLTYRPDSNTQPHMSPQKSQQSQQDRISLQGPGRALCLQIHQNSNICQSTTLLWICWNLQDNNNQDQPDMAFCPLILQYSNSLRYKESLLVQHFQQSSTCLHQSLHHILPCPKTHLCSSDPVGSRSQKASSCLACNIARGLLCTAVGQQLHRHNRIQHRKGIQWEQLYC
mmetsp:Transcript_51701/g.108021  ORF Transcript_51701/g.108021 Transcript_51701/m.108021 type:complete len:294 (-) Transcript_51701:3824-4705(-)